MDRAPYLAVLKADFSTLLSSISPFAFSCSELKFHASFSSELQKALQNSIPKPRKTSFSLTHPPGGKKPRKIHVLLYSWLQNRLKFWYKSSLDPPFDNVLLCNWLQNRFRNCLKSSILDPPFDDILLYSWLQNRFGHCPKSSILDPPFDAFLLYIWLLNRSRNC